MKKFKFNVNFFGCYSICGNGIASKPGFTLAEVLVTLGIIGVVAAMTIPTLMQNHQRKVYVTQLQKVYTELQQAINRKINDANAINLRESGMYHDENYTKEKEFLHTYFKVAKDCGLDALPCFAPDGYDSMTGGTGVKVNTLKTYYTVSLASGATIGAKISNRNLGIFVDINGPQGPNLKYRDFFVINVDDNGQLRSFAIENLISKGWVMDSDYDSEPCGDT